MTPSQELLFQALAPYIEAALQYADGTHTVDDIREMVNAGRLQFWPGPQSVLITEILETPRRRTLNFFLAGGNLTDIERMYDSIIAWGRTQGCTHATMFGRPGWQRTFLKQRGWHVRPMVQMEVSL